MTLVDYLADCRAEVDAALDAWLPRIEGCPSVVAQAMRYSVMAGGKRLRPILTLSSAEVTATRTATSPVTARRLALPAACALEMIHTYSLVHDDLPAMDDDTLRRGRPTLHVVYGDGLAILAGDGLQAEAFGLLARQPDTNAPDIVARKLRVLSTVAEAAGVAGMVGGQAIDLAAVGRQGEGVRPLDAGGLSEMHERKTGALIRASVIAGAVMAGADAVLLDALGRYASDIGLGFQIIDDVLDVEGEGAALGKTAGKDAASGKPTYPAFYGVTRSREMAAQCLVRARAALADVDLASSRLIELAEWMVDRRN